LNSEGLNFYADKNSVQKKTYGISVGGPTTDGSENHLPRYDTEQRKAKDGGGGTTAVYRGRSDKYQKNAFAVGNKTEYEESLKRKKDLTARDYETVGYVISGKAELHFENDQKVLLSQGDSWIVPKGSKHTYKIIENFTAVEATHPPAEIKNRDAPTTH